MQLDDTIQAWHTCKTTDRGPRYNCSEYVFLDDTSCNLASANLMKFLRPNGSFDVEGYRHACRLFFLAQEIAVEFRVVCHREDHAPLRTEFRPLGLGYANLGTTL